MRMTMRSTPRFVLIDGVRCRVWEGITDRAIKVEVYVRGIRSNADDDLGELDAELTEMPLPSISVPS